MGEDMKQRIIVIVAVVVVLCLLGASLLSILRANQTPPGPDLPEQSESQSGSGSQAEPESESDVIYTEYTGECHPGTGIVYQGSGENADIVIVIDAGHQLHAMSETEPNGPGSETMKAKVTGGTQSSTTGLAEYELNLRVSLALRDQLVAKGYQVVMVRETNEVEISNAERALLANEMGANVNIRIHANGDTNPNTKGAMTVCQTPDNPYNANIYEQCRALSDAVLSAFCQSTGIQERNVWETDTMTGTNWASVPTTILEMGFMTNPEDDAAMAAEGFAQAAAQGIVEGIVQYLAQGKEQNDSTQGEQTAEPDDTTQSEQTEIPTTEQPTEQPDNPYGIDYALEAELGERFTDVYTTVEATATVWVRTEPSTRGGESTQVNSIRTYAGKSFVCIGLGENWHRVLIDGNVYYISAAYLKVVEE